MNIIIALKHFFIPHEHNEYKPHFFREACISILLGITLLLFSFSATSAYIIQGTEIGKNIISKVLVDLTNENRQIYKLSILTPSKKLYDASLLKAKDMSNQQYFAHESPSGTTAWDFLEKVKYDYTYAGENLAINHKDNSETEKAWMESTLHRKNILDPNFKEIGISAYSSLYENKDTIFVVQMFAAPIEIEGEIKIEKPEQIKNETRLEKSKLVQEVKERKEILDNKVDIKIIPTVSDMQPKKIEVLGTSMINYSNVYERFIYAGSSRVQNALQILFIIIFFAAVLMIFVEIKKQHMRHIAYAALLLIILSTLMYLNKNYLEVNFIFLK